jgi:hypothetical protein
MYPLYNTPFTEDVVLALIRASIVHGDMAGGVKWIGADDAFCVFGLGMGELVRDEVGLGGVEGSKEGW